MVFLTIKKTIKGGGGGKKKKDGGAYLREKVGHKGGRHTGA